ncbi:hypothetical protein GNP80_03775 [Aliivibrio fischeri]|uniref:hypothetical protein n=1 Tax=Aliivibrio fischeri TaxID=668 RepID=UPI0012D8C156|nr:hypothetical protein [Aliivibrio fischeri]MUK91570.1 hypothetical protein [Aliivibrio fischeri]
MIAAWKWIKLLAIAALFVTIWVLWLKLEASELEQTVLSNKLSKAAADNSTNLETIEILKGEAASANQLLVKRKQQQIEAEGKLNAEMEKLKQQMATIKCHVPTHVTERLRESY